ncbi:MULTISPECIES: hypothetical protein [unclassified Streptomyces]|uniref:hypothetical protein n=1 Tax=unclassified Streptomyces TaxID=2593676 RepID=UPI0036DFB158
MSRKPAHLLKIAAIGLAAIAIVAWWMLCNGALAAATAQTTINGDMSGASFGYVLGLCGTLFFATLAGAPIGIAMAVTASVVRDEATRAGFMLGTTLGTIAIPWILWYSGVPSLAAFQEG